MRTLGKSTGKTRGSLLPIVLLLVVALLTACQGAAPASPTAAPKPAAASAPTAAPAAAAAPTAAPQAATPKTVSVKIGFQPAYTGILAAQTELQSQGMNDYLTSVNDQGGIAYKDPKTGENMLAKLDLVWEDNGYDVARVLSVYQRQKQAAVKAILITGTIGGTALAETVSKDKLPIMVFGGVSEAVLKPSPRYVTTWLNQWDMQSRSFVKWAKDNWKESRAPRLGILAADTTVGQLISAGLPEFAQKLGWEVLNKELLAEPLTDSSIQVKRLMDGNPDWVFVGGLNANSMAIIMKDATRLGLKDKTKWVVNSSSFDPTTFQKVADAETDGAYGWVYWVADPQAKDVPGVVAANAASQKNRNAPASLLDVQGYGVATVFVGAIKAALQNVGYDALTPEAINTALHSLKDLDTGGIYGLVSTTEDQPWIVGKARLLQWKDHKVNVLTDWQDGSIH